MRYLLPKQLKTHGLKETEINVPESVIRDIVRYFTREKLVCADWNKKLQKSAVKW